jgi:4'-phosphopantetheinyl transferase
MALHSSIQELPSPVDEEYPDLRVWQLDTQRIDLTPTETSLLSSDELYRASQFRHKRHREQFIATRSVLRWLLGQKLNFPAKKILFAYTKTGRPEIKHPATPVQFSISHSDSITLIGFVPDVSIGVDIEQHNPCINPLEIGKSVFCPQEIQLIQNCHESARIALFYRIWTCKEAMLKMLGNGFSQNPCELCINDTLEGRHIICQNSFTPVKIIQLDVGCNHTAALALQPSNL